MVFKGFFGDHTSARQQEMRSSGILHQIRLIW